MFAQVETHCSSLWRCSVTVRRRSYSKSSKTSPPTTSVMWQSVKRHFPNVLCFIVGVVMGLLLTVQIRYFTVFAGSRLRSCFSSRVQRTEDINIDPPSEDRALIFVGVMTAGKYLDTRAIAAYRTWANSIPGRVIFFTSGTAEIPQSAIDANLPIVRLIGVDDSYPPQKKSFLMLHWMYSKAGNRYKWFMRADDDVYIRGDRLELLLRSIDHTKSWFIGQAGVGNKDEVGQLHLAADENFCMGGPGIVMSRPTLEKMFPGIPYCLTHMYSTHEDVEIGRCVRKFAGVACTWAYEMQNIFYHNSSGSEAFTGRLKQREVHRAITLHPIKDHNHMYRVHSYIRQLGIQQQHIHNKLRLQRDINRILYGLHYNRSLNANLRKLLKEGEKVHGKAGLLGQAPYLNKGLPNSSEEITPWVFFQRLLYSYDNANPRRRPEKYMKEALEDVVTQVMEMINGFSKQRGRVIDFKDVLYGYTRAVPPYGVDYILDLLLVYKKYRGRKMTIPVRKHVYVQQTFSQLLLNLEDSDSTMDDEARADGLQPISKKENVNLLVPLMGRFRIFRRFLENFEEILRQDGDVRLLIMLFHDDSILDKEEDEALEEVRKLNLNFPTRLEVVRVKGPFSRALALEIGAAHFNAEALLMFIDVDIEFTVGALERVRRNTIFGQRVYYPIVFSQYEPSLQPEQSNAISEDSGHFRHFGFGIMSIYNADLLQVGGFDTSIQGWGKEDVDLFDKVVQSNLTIFRAVDPGLLHIYHPVHCNESLISEQLEMCVGTLTNSLASQRVLARIIQNNEHILGAEKSNN